MDNTAKNTLRVIYFGGSIGVYLNDELYTHKPYTNGSIEDLFNKCLDLMTKNIESVEKYGISDESEFWDHVKYSANWMPPIHFTTFKQYCITI